MGNAGRGIRNKRSRRNLLIPFLICGGMGIAVAADGAEDPDELYQNGRFADARKIYARLDMDHPRDLRYRYNRGCAEYEAGDYPGAMAAFASVLRRTEDREIRFKAAYNLGNAAFKQGDAVSAAEYYRQALRIDPTQANASHNLELALRKIEAQKKEKEKKEKPSGQEGDTKGSKQDGDKGEERDKPSSKDGSEKGEGPEKDAPQEGKPQDPDRGAEQDQEQKPDAAPSGDLSGELKPLEALPESSEEPESGKTTVSAMDRKKAEALLDNITEDRSKFLRLQAPEGRRRGAVSGKDW